MMVMTRPNCLMVRTKMLAVRTSGSHELTQNDCLCCFITLDKYCMNLDVFLWLYLLVLIYGGLVIILV